MLMGVFKAIFVLISIVLIVVVALVAFAAEHSRFYKFSSYAHAIAHDAFSEVEKNYAICGGAGSYSEVACKNYEVRSRSEFNKRGCWFVQSNATAMIPFFNRYRVKYVTKENDQEFLQRLNSYEFNKFKKISMSSGYNNPAREYYSDFHKFHFSLHEKVSCGGFFIYTVGAK